MSRFVIQRTNIAMPDAKGLEGASHLLFKSFDGFGEEGSKAWRKLWKRLFNLETGELVEVDFVVPRNPLFHRKFFALLQVGFDAWKPTLTHDGKPIEKDFEQFREDVTILAGHYIQTWTLDGEMRLRAKSISFRSMDDVAFEKVYSSVANVLLSRVLTTYRDRQELDNVVERVMRFL